MINNEDKKYYGTDYSTQAILMEEEIIAFLNNINSTKLGKMKKMRNIAEKLKQDKNNMNLQRELQDYQNDLNDDERLDSELHSILDMVKQLKNGQLPANIPPKILYDKIMDIPLMQDLTVSDIYGMINGDIFESNFGFVDEAMEKYIEENFDIWKDEQNLQDNYNIDFSQFDFGKDDFNAFVREEVRKKFSSEQKLEWIKEMRDEGMISNRDYLRTYIANEAHKRKQLALEMSRQQSVLNQTEENSFGGMRSSR